MEHNDCVTLAEYEELKSVVEDQEVELIDLREKLAELIRRVDKIAGKQVG